MTNFCVIVDGEDDFTFNFDGEPQINLTFEHQGRVYRVTSRAHDERREVPTLHAICV